MQRHDYSVYYGVGVGSYYHCHQHIRNIIIASPDMCCYGINTG